MDETICIILISLMHRPCSATGEETIRTLSHPPRSKFKLLSRQWRHFFKSSPPTFGVPPTNAPTPHTHFKNPKYTLLQHTFSHNSSTGPVTQLLRRLIGCQSHPFMSAWPSYRLDLNSGLHHLTEVNSSALTLLTKLPYIFFSLFNRKFGEKNR